MKLKLKSARQQIEENEAARDKQFALDYPDGRYVLQKITRQYGKPCPASYTMGNVRRQGHLAWARAGTVVSMTDGKLFTGNSVWAVAGTNFDSRAACLEAARKRGFPEQLIQAFNEALDKRRQP